MEPVVDTRVGTAPGPPHRATLDAAAEGAGLVSAFQRVVSLPTEAVVGYEALARWPDLGVGPLDVFTHAAEVGKLDTVDQLAISSATRHALAATSAPGMLLLVNCEPGTTYDEVAADPCLGEAASTFRLMFEFTERGLLDNPRRLLRKVEALRDRGCGIALDDVGARVESLALLDVLEPDIVKMDMGLIQSQPDAIQARTVAAIIAHHERTGAVVLAEGIETDEHLEQALAYGATLGQGYRFGHPGMLDTAPPAQAWPRLHGPTVIPQHVTPFELVAAGMQTRIVRKATLIELGRHIERLALLADSAPIVLTTLQEAQYFSGGTRRIYQKIAGRSPLTAVFGQNLPESDGGPVKQVALQPTDPLALEWSVLILGPDTAAALVAREHYEPRAAPREISESDRRFDMVVTFDRLRVAHAARSLLARI